MISGYNTPCWYQFHKSQFQGRQFIQAKIRNKLLLVERRKIKLIRKKVS